MLVEGSPEGRRHVRVKVRDRRGEHIIAGGDRLSRVEHGRDVHASARAGGRRLLGIALARAAEPERRSDDRLGGGLKREARSENGGGDEGF